MKRFKNKNILVTGGARGIGKAIVKRFVKEGARVFFTYNSSKNEAKFLSRELTGVTYEYKLDVRDFKKSESAVNRIIKEYAYIDILINNAGITADNSIQDMRCDEFRNVIDTNLMGVFNLSKSVIPHMVSRRKGRIVNISSISAIKGVSQQINYSASKAAILGFSRSLAKEVARFNITVNAVCPGFIETDMFNKLPAFSRSSALKNIPLGRIGKSQEVAGLVAYLSSEEAAYITGQVFIIDGGLSI